MKAKQIVRRLLKKYSQKESPILAITGDHGNNIAVPNRTGYIYARLPNGDVVQVYNSIAPLALDIDITIGFNPKDPNLLQVTSIIGARGRYGSGDVQKVGPLSHHKSHEWMANSGATDVVFSELRQFMPFRPTPEGGMSLHVNRGVAWINDAWQHTSGSSIDFAPYVTDMVSGTAQYALAYLDSSGVPDFIIGSGNLTTMSALTLDDIPDAYPGTVPIAAIKLRGNQTGIVEAKTYTDLIDLRFPFRHDHPFTDLDGLYYGHIYTNATIAVTITGSTSAFEVGDTFTTGEMNGCAFGSAHYIDVGANGAGKYLIAWSMSIAQNTPSAAIECEQGIMIDGVAQVQGRAHRAIANSTDIGASAGTAILDLAASKQVSLFIINETNATNIDVEHANLTITMIGGT